MFWPRCPKCSKEITGEEVQLIFGEERKMKIDKSSPTMLKKEVKKQDLEHNIDIKKGFCANCYKFVDVFRIYTCHHRQLCQKCFSNKQRPPEKKKCKICNAIRGLVVFDRLPSQKEAGSKLPGPSMLK